MSEYRTLGRKTTSIQKIGEATVGGRYEGGLLWLRGFLKNDCVTRQARLLLIEHTSKDVERVKQVGIYTVSFEELRLPTDRNSSIKEVRVAAIERGFILLTVPMTISTFLNMEQELRAVASGGSIYFLSRSFVGKNERPMIFRAGFPGTLPIFGAAEALENKRVWKPEHKFVVAKVG